MSRYQSSSRVEWVDSAKGLAILLVVLQHTALILGQSDLPTGPWMQINNGLQVFRMPVFFAASGLFAVSALASDWVILWKKRLSMYAWVFILWTLIRFLYFIAFPMESRPAETDPWSLLVAPIAPATGLWFLHALFFFFIVAKVMHGRVDYRLQLGVAAILSILFLSFSGGNISWTGMGKYFFFFLAGCYLRDILVHLAGGVTWMRVLTFGSLFVAAVLASVRFDLQMFGPVAFAVRVVAVLFGFLLASAVASLWLGRVLAVLGRRTLQIYVAHVLMIAFIGSGRHGS